MKIKEYLYMIGLKPRQQTYGYTIRTFNAGRYGEIEYAQWNHPYEKEKIISEENIAYLQTIISEGDFCIDIGAHSGDTTVPMAIAAGSSGMVLALEPNAFVFPTLSKNAFLNQQKSNITPLMIAATETDCDMVFEYSDSGFCNGGNHRGISKWQHGHAFNLTVNGINLCNLLVTRFPQWLKKLKYIKIDAEGYDFYILKSLESIIDLHKPLIKAEIFKHTSTQYREDIYNFFSSKNYTIYKVENEENYTGAQLCSIEEMSIERHFDIYCTSFESTP